MAVKFTYDFANRLLIISSSVTEIDVQVDLYSDWKEDILSNVFNPGVAEPFRTTAGDPIGGGNQIAPYFFLINGWTIRPFEGNHTLTIRGNLFTDPADLAIIVPTLGDFTVNAIIERAVDSTAILLDAPAIQHSSYEGGVWIDPSSAFAGTDFPIGTLLEPVNNVADALLIAAAAGLHQLFLLEDVSFTNAEDISELEIIGHIPEASVFISESTNVNNAQFTELNVFGVVVPNGDDAHFEGCTLSNVTWGGKSGHEIVLADTLFLTGSGPFSFFHVIDNDPSAGGVKLDLSGIASGTQIGIRDYFGSIEIISCSTNVDMAVDIRGRVFFDSTVSSGSFRIRGIGSVVNQSTGDTVVNEDDLIGFEVKTELDEIIVSQSLAASVGGALTPDQANMLIKLYDVMGLDPTKPLVVTPEARTVSSSISQSITTVGREVTVTRTL